MGKVGAFEQRRGEDLEEMSTEQDRMRKGGSTAKGDNRSRRGRRE
jgi:hypothetical protein